MSIQVATSYDMLEVVVVGGCGGGSGCGGSDGGTGKDQVFRISSKEGNIYTHTHTYIYIYKSMFVCVCI